MLNLAAISFYLEANRRNEQETCSDSDSGDIMSPLLGD